MEHDKRIQQVWFGGRSRRLLAMLLVVAVGSVCWAQPGAPARAAQVAEPNEPQVDFSNGVLIKFIAFQKDTSVREGLRLLAVYCKKNIVPYSQVDGMLTVSRLYNVTFDQALDAVLGNKFKYEQDGDFVKVYTTEELKKLKADPERMVDKVIRLYYITADEASKLVQPALSGAPEAKVAVTTAAKKTISAGAGGAPGSGGGLGAATGGGDEMAQNDMIVVHDYPENVERAEAIIREVDAKPKQVLVEATLLAARLTEEMNFGIDWNLLSGVNITTYPANVVGGQGTYAETFGFANQDVLSGSLPGLTVGFSADNVQAIITALESITDTTLLANPKILAVNKQEGSVLIGKKLGYVDTTTQNQSGSTTQSVAFLNTGTQLVFRPYIGEDKYIRMDIYPKDSDGVVKSNGIPDETTTELRTNVLVKDGETVIIGGLFRDSTTTSRSQIPVLGNLPVVGALFRGVQDTVVREEVIVMLTPHIITDPTQADAKDRLDDVRLKRAGAVKALQGIDAAKLAETAYASAARHYLEGDTGKALYYAKLAIMMRPTYLEAQRLRERIIAETDPEQLKKLNDMVVEKLDEQEAPNWRRY